MAKKQNAIFTMTLRLRAIEDVKSDIKYDAHSHDLDQLSTNILKAHVNLQEKIAKEDVQWEKDHPIILDERHPREDDVNPDVYPKKFKALLNRFMCVSLFSN